jgi:hypothetical protein
MMVFEIIKGEDFIGYGFYVETLQYVNSKSDD